MSVRPANAIDHQLYRDAIRADEAYTAALKAAGLDRWGPRPADESHPVNVARRAKMAADRARHANTMASFG